MGTVKSRRRFLSQLMAASGAFISSGILKSEHLEIDCVSGATQNEFTLNYLFPTCLYGYMDLQTILPEVKKTGATSIDIWPMIHGNQREQLDEMGEDNFKRLLKKHKLKLGSITQYKLGPYHLTEEMDLAARLDCQLIITGTTEADGPKGLTGQELKNAIKSFIERLKPHLAKAEEKDITIAIENNSGLLLDSIDAIKYFSEFAGSKSLKLALAPPHLPQNAEEIASLIRFLGNDKFKLFYAWELGNGFKNVNHSREKDMMQLPGRGTLDFTPIVSALRNINYQGFTEIFMHPTPRGISIAETAPLVTEEIINIQKYLANCLINH